MTALREITGQYLQLLDLAQADDVPADAVRDTLAGIEGEFNDKAIKVVDVVQAIEGDVEAIDKEIQRLQDRKKTIKARENSIRDYLRDNMEACGINKIQCPLFTITLTKGRDVVVIDDEREIPDHYIAVKTSTQPDKKALLEALKEKSVPGAHIEKSKPSLRIK